MMGGKLVGMQQVLARTKQIFDEVQSVKAVRAIKSATFIIRTESATMTPIETSTLINSQFDTVEINGTRITGRVGYSARYALYVHNAPGKLLGLNRPRPSGKGVYWGPHAEPQFLLKAGTKTKELVDRIIRQEMKL